VRGAGRARERDSAMASRLCPASASVCGFGMELDRLRTDSSERALVLQPAGGGLRCVGCL
jgi:hypothetical protein